jgi:hypothetical protein
MQRFFIERSKDEFYTSHSGLALVGLFLNRFCNLAAKLDKAVPVSSIGILSSDVVKAFIGLVCIGKTDYEAITDKKGDSFFKKSLGLKKVPSAETLRQRFDEFAERFLPIVRHATIEMLKGAKAGITALSTGHVPLYFDLTPLDNSNTKKEGVSYTYKKFDGYGLMAAYLGLEGWLMEAELREGSQHCQSGFVPFLLRSVSWARMLTDKKLLITTDSGHDALENRLELASLPQVDYIIKWNPRKESPKYWLAQGQEKGREIPAREGKRIFLLNVVEKVMHEEKEYSFRRVMRVIERTIDKFGQRILTPEIEIEGWWTSLAFAEEKVIELYKGQGLCEQFHSELKSDMDLERLPSGKFATNALVTTCGAMAYNILRFIGQLGLLGERSPVRHPAKRRRIKTVIQELIYLAGRIISKGRKLILRLSRHCPAFEVFDEVYTHLAYG